MKYNHKALFYSAILFLAFHINNVYASSNSDTQSLIIKIPKIALIDVNNTEASFKFTTDSNETQQHTNIAISSNDANAHMNVQVHGIPQGLKLHIVASSDICKQAAHTVTKNSNMFSCLTGVTRTKNGRLTLTAIRDNQTIVQDGTYRVNFTYTLVD